jgi:hypothetical protein
MSQTESVSTKGDEEVCSMHLDENEKQQQQYTPGNETSPNECDSDSNIITGDGSTSARDKNTDELCEGKLKPRLAWLLVSVSDNPLLQKLAYSILVFLS